jgi:hypothetical protein
MMIGDKTPTLQGVCSARRHKVLALKLSARLQPRCLLCTALARPQGEGKSGQIRTSTTPSHNLNNQPYRVHWDGNTDHQNQMTSVQ